MQSLSMKDLSLQDLSDVCREKQLRVVIDVGRDALKRMGTMGKRLSLTEYGNGGTLLVPYPELQEFTTIDEANAIQIRRIKEIRLISARHNGKIAIAGDGNEVAIIAAVGGCYAGK